jgi:guanine deaminase
MKPSDFMSRAVTLALENVRKGNGGPFAALIVKDGQIIAEGANHVTTQNDPTAHAEVVAIRRACQVLGTFQLNGCELYSTCEPCPMCMGAIYWARPDRVYYASNRYDAASAGFDDQFIYDEISKPIAARKIPFEQLGSSIARQIFEAWKLNESRIEY